MTADLTTLTALVVRLADRDRIRSEANIQADVRQLLLSGDLGLADHDLSVDLETQVGDRRRIDVEVGATVVEVKRDLSSQAVLNAAVVQLAGYVRERTSQTGQRYSGILTDGRLWIGYRADSEGDLTEATRFEVNPGRPDPLGLMLWLEGVLSTTRGVRPSPVEVARRLGADSSAHAMDRATLATLYEQNKTLPTVALKRGLWAKLLTSALGTQFEDTDELFIEHTLLVNSAEIIAHLVVGLDVGDLAPATILGGVRFEQAGIHGVVDRDFFDWVLEVEGGQSFVRTLARRLTRFDWSHVEHDVLKVLYESIIGADTRRRLGEYYTPDWLASQVVETAVTNPLAQRVLDPACGSGTFLFHAVRRYLDAAEASGMTVAQALEGVSSHVMGVDLHPVAVALARVTYLLAIGRQRLIDPGRREIHVPVYLGDSVQWDQRIDLFTEGHLVVSAGQGGTLFEDELKFPETLLDDPRRFDQLVSDMADLAAAPRARGSVPSLNGLFKRLAIADADQAAIRDSFEVLCRLQDDGRNHIWSYYVRNLARPVWLTQQANRVHVMVGNPPWLAYRHMPADMQSTFVTMTRSRGLWPGGETATHADLSALFLARTVQQYLRIGGTFAFVMPNAVLDRPHFAGLRSGVYPDATEQVTVAFTGSWDLRRLRPHFFPRGSCVVFGTRTREVATPMPLTTERWTGRLPKVDSGWQSVAAHITRQSATVTLRQRAAETSPYEPRFSQGATIVPRLLFMVETPSAGPLGLAAGRQAVRSVRSSTEKKPWRDLSALEGSVEAEFIRPVLLGESIVPFRVLPARHAVLPIEGKEILHSGHSHLDHYPGLAAWWRQAEALWLKHRSSDRLTLIERLDYMRGLSSQLPLQPLRVVYSKAGMHVAAAIVTNPTVVIDHKLYWATVSTLEEGQYLCAILNSPQLTDFVRPFMSYGKDERDIDKAVWRLPIPTYDPDNTDHARLAALGQAQADTVARLDLSGTPNFVAARRHVREVLAATSEAAEIAAIIEPMLTD